MKGLGVSPGYAAAPALLYRPARAKAERRTVPQAQAAAELARFQSAVERAEEQIAALEQRAGELLSGEDAKVFSAHRLLLQDAALHNMARAYMEKEQLAAEWAVERAMGEICARLEQLDNPLLRERAADVRDVCGRLLNVLMGVAAVDISCLEHDCILLAEDLTPSDTMQMDMKRVKGIVTELGGKTSHTAILARSLELPAIVGVKGLMEAVANGAKILMDALEGTVVIDPGEESLNAHMAKQSAYEEGRRELAHYAHAPSLTKDGKKIEIAANIGSAKEGAAALAYGPDGIGLFRTEFLFMGRSAMPTEEEQFTEYRKAAQAAGGKPVIFRTLDIGGDKALPYVDFEGEENPFLGWRAIRMCLDREELFLTQLRALLRASSYGRFRIMYPMIINREELRRANALLRQAQEELHREGADYDEDIQVGIMIETPAAALLADKLAAEVDFFSIGTNDLTQYTLAVDRGNQRVSHLYQPCHPGVLRLIEGICAGARAAGIWVGMCGEMAGDESMTALLLGLGLDELSMSASAVPRVRKAAAEINMEEAKALARQALDCGCVEEVRALLAL